MEYRTLVKAGVKRYKEALIGIFFLLFLVSLSLGTVWNVWINSNRYIDRELDRAGFGALTAWVSGVEDLSLLTEQMEAVDGVEGTDIQSVIFSNYTIGEQESDSEGQLILWNPGEKRYRFFANDLSGYQEAPDQIVPGTVYVSPSLVSMFGLELGGTVAFSIARNGGTVSLTVAGFYEDPFMGSSMIGMKGFLISPSDYETFTLQIADAGIDALARSGGMIHVFSSPERAQTTAALNAALNTQTDLTRYTEFVHSADAIAGFMMVLQDAFSSLFLAFVLVLLVVVLIVLSHSVSGTVEAERKNLGILKSIGMRQISLQTIQLLQYAAAIVPALVLGFLLAAPLAGILMGMTLTTTGIRIPTPQPWGISILSLLALALVLAGFIWLKTRSIGNISPMEAIRQSALASETVRRGLPQLKGNHLPLSLAIRQVLTKKRNYVSACLVALLLVFFVSLVGRMDSWLGPDGKGMMDAFNPADHDIGVQMFGTSTSEDALAVLSQYTQVTDTYLLAMPGVAVEGIDCTANVISEPERFHILEGSTCYGDNEIVITEFIAADLGVSIGDTLTVSASLGEAEYVISGIYSCANDMGDTIGMGQEGYLKIGQDSPEIWCHHYFLADPAQKAAVTEALTDAFGGDVHVHENTWPGLFGIISAMRLLVIFMYGMVIVFVLTVTAMTGARLLRHEQRDIGIYKALGFTDRMLRGSFALRFGLIAGIGSVLGSVIAALLTDPLVSSVMKLAGISSFTSNPSIPELLMPGLVVTALFTAFAYFAARKIRRTDLTILISA